MDKVKKLLTMPILNKILFLSLILLTLLQIHNISLFPENRGFDATGHPQYIQYIKTYKSVPIPDKGWEFYHPPLYYLIASFFPTVSSAQWLGFISWFSLLLISYYFFGDYPWFNISGKSNSSNLNRSHYY